MKKRIIITIVIAILLSSLSLVNYLTKEPYDINKEINKCMEQENYSYRVNDGKVYCYMTTKSSDTTTTSTTTTKVKTTKKTTKKTTVQKVNVSENEITRYLYQEVLNKGWSSEDYNAVVNIIIRESSFNVNSVNSKTGACGLFQAYPCNKMKSYGSDYRTNYKVQIAWGLDYIKNRYKTPVKAWEFWQQHKWY